MFNRSKNTAFRLILLSAGLGDNFLSICGEVQGSATVFGGLETEEVQNFSLHRRQRGH